MKTDFTRPLSWRRGRAAFRHALHLATGSLAFAAATASAHEVIVYSYLTEAGKTVNGPSPDHRTRLLLAGGRYVEAGAIVTSERSPPPDQVFDLVRRAVAAGYHDGTAAFPAGDVIGFYFWGTMRPLAVGDDSGREIILNHEVLLRLVGAPALDLWPLGAANREEILAAAQERRHFVVIAGYDFVAYASRRERRLLWVTQMSVRADGLSPTQAVPLMLAAGAPLLGRETRLPLRIEIGVAGVLRPLAVK